MKTPFKLEKYKTITEVSSTCLLFGLYRRNKLLANHRSLKRRFWQAAQKPIQLTNGPHANPPGANKKSRSRANSASEYRLKLSYRFGISSPTIRSARYPNENQNEGDPIVKNRGGGVELSCGGGWSIVGCTGSGPSRPVSLFFALT